MAVRGWWVLLSVVPLLAGCFGGDRPDSPEQATTSSTFAVTVGEPVEPAPPTLTNTLRFANGDVGNLFTTIEPDAYEPVRIPIQSFASTANLLTGALVESEYTSAFWNFTWPADVGSIRGEFVLVVDVQGFVLGTPRDDPATDSCFWSVGIAITDPARTPGQGLVGSATSCIPEPLVVPEGIRTLRIPFELPAASYAAGYHAGVNLLGGAVAYGPDARVDLLSGAINHDSTLSFEGIGWPAGLEKVTLLTTTS